LVRRAAAANNIALIYPKKIQPDCPGGRGYFRGAADALPNGVAEFAPQAIASLSIPVASLVEGIGWPTTRGGLR
jgi:hypothetical protein